MTLFAVLQHLKDSLERLNKMNKALTLELQLVREEGEAHARRNGDVLAESGSVGLIRRLEISQAPAYVSDSDEDRDLIPVAAAESPKAIAQRRNAQAREFLLSISSIQAARARRGRGALSNVCHSVACTPSCSMCMSFLHHAIVPWLRINSIQELVIAS
jgi:hypothetical protein